MTTNLTSSVSFRLLCATFAILLATFTVLLTGCTEIQGADTSEKVFRVGSKKFTESIILGEVIRLLASDHGVPATHAREIGSSQVLWKALVRGEIDAYVEYTGTLSSELLKTPTHDIEGLRDLLKSQGLGLAGPLGFNDTYAVGVQRRTAREKGLVTIGDLVRVPDLRLGFSHEFLDRAEGWPSLRKAYALPQTAMPGLDHDIAYRALAEGKIDATDLYSTDAEIPYYDLVVLKDDKHHFPEYLGIVLYRLDAAKHYPRAIDAIQQLQGNISESDMSTMNAAVKIRREAETDVAARFLRQEFSIGSDSARGKTATDGGPAAGLEPAIAAKGTRFFGGRLNDRLVTLAQETLEHLTLVLISLCAAFLVGVPLGILVGKRQVLRKFVLGFAGVLQTIPSLALLVFMIPLLGIGARPAIAALFLYSLLPIVENTSAGLLEIPRSIHESAEALGLPAFARLRLIELPMAARVIVSGLRSAAVINIGTATLGALVGAGGYGQSILVGIRKDDVGIILWGAVPAAVLALAAQGVFGLVERAIDRRPGAGVLRLTRWRWWR